MTKTRTKELEPIYSLDYYRMEKLVKSHHFQARLQELRASWKKWGVPMPAEGFERVKEYYAWRDRLLAVYNKHFQSEDVAQAVKQVDNDPSLSAMEKYWRRTEVQDEHLPLLPWSVMDQLLKEVHLDPKNKKYQEFLTRYIFFRQEKLLETLLSTWWKDNKKTGEKELFLKLEPHTKREHILALWDKIAEEQKKLLGYRGKNKPWKSFDRDFEIYTVRQEVKATMRSKRTGNRLEKKGVDIEVRFRLQDTGKPEFKRLSLDQIRKSASRIAKLDR